MRSRTPLLLFLLLAAPAAAWGQERPKLMTKKEARARVLAFLTSGPKPIRTIDREQVESMTVREGKNFGHGETFELNLNWETGRLVCSIVVGRRDGQIVYLWQSDRQMEYAEWDERRFRREAEIRKELTDRTHFSRKQLRSRAWTWMARFYPDLAERRFEIVREEIRSANGMAEWRLVFVEQPGKGVLAHFPNRAVLRINPETGALIAASTTNLRYEVRRPPAVSKDRAVEMARRAASVGPDAKARAELTVYLPKPLSPTVTWSVDLGGRAYVAIDAATGATLDVQRPRKSDWKTKKEPK